MPGSNGRDHVFFMGDSAVESASDEAVPEEKTRVKERLVLNASGTERNIVLFLGPSDASRFPSKHQRADEFEAWMADLRSPENP
jgi:hypothetical protein